MTASQRATGISRNTNTVKILEQYRIEADYGVNYRKFAQCTQSFSNFKEIYSIQTNPAENYQGFHNRCHKDFIDGNIHTCISTAKMSI